MTNGMKPWKMGDFLSVKHGYPFQSEHFATEGHYVVVTPGNFYEAGGFKRIPGKEKYFTAQFPAEYLLKKGDLVVAMTQQTAGLLGSTAIIPADDEYLHNQRIGLISFDETVVDKLYLYYLFMTRSVRKQIEDSASGTKIKHTSPDKIYDVVVYLPDLDVQKHVGQLMWDIEQKITNNSCISVELESMAKTLYDYWFVQFDFPDANGKPYRSSGGEMVWNEQLKREIPKGWGATTMDSLTTVLTGKEDANFSKPNGKYKFFTCSQDTILCDIPAFEGHAVLIAGNGDFNVKHYTGSFNAYQRTYVLIPKEAKHYAVMWIAAQKRIKAFKQGSNGSIVKFITKGDVENIPIILPNDDAYLDTFNRTLEKIEQCERENDELTKLHTWLLPMLMNGQATIEPAESAPKLRTLQPEKPACDPRFDRWLQTQGVAARGTVDEQTLHDIFDAMDDDDKQ